ncbi:hypothetical protein C8R47DRAFT_1066242 [Mycena vitilis]|nr:hypothetical protein C8R47DRAFT_1066242 [Mycena vitilis]
MSLNIPPEVCSLICAAVVHRAELATLCRTSRAFRDEAQRILYRRVNLGHQTRQLKSLALAVTRHSHLAERVHTLVLRLPETLKLSPLDGSRIKDTLGACINLKELRVSCADAYPFSSPASIDGWMLNDASFRLIKFANSYFRFDCIMGFLDAQSEICVFSTTTHYGRFPSSDAQLPNLIAISVVSLESLPAGRPLQRIETRFHHDYSPLVRYSGTLTSLHLMGQWMDYGSTLSDTLIIISDMLPALVKLGVTEQRKNRTPTLIELTPMATLRKFSRLETFLLLVRNVVRFDDQASARVYEMEDEQDLEDLGQAIMMTCSKLHRVVVGAHVQLGQELNCTLTRTTGGEVRSKRGYELSSDGVSMFWDP